MLTMFWYTHNIKTVHTNRWSRKFTIQRALKSTIQKQTVQYTPTHTHTHDSHTHTHAPPPPPPPPTHTHTNTPTHAHIITLTVRNDSSQQQSSVSSIRGSHTNYTRIEYHSVFHQRQNHHNGPLFCTDVTCRYIYILYIYSYQHKGCNRNWDSVLHCVSDVSACVCIYITPGSREKQTPFSPRSTVLVYIACGVPQHKRHSLKKMRSLEIDNTTAVFFCYSWVDKVHETTIRTSKGKRPLYESA